MVIGAGELPPPVSLVVLLSPLLSFTHPHIDTQTHTHTHTHKHIDTHINTHSSTNTHTHTHTHTQRYTKTHTYTHNHRCCSETWLACSTTAGLSKHDFFQRTLLGCKM